MLNELEVKNTIVVRINTCAAKVWNVPMLWILSSKVESGFES
jgi:hypothetical protein